MSKPSRVRVLQWSAAASALINLFLVSSAFVGGAKSNYLKLANTIAAPPGLIASRFLAPKEHSAGAFVDAAVGSLICSFLFYAVVCWLLIQAVLQTKLMARR